MWWPMMAPIDWYRANWIHTTLILYYLFVALCVSADQITPTKLAIMIIIKMCIPKVSLPFTYTRIQVSIIIIHFDVMVRKTIGKDISLCLWPLWNIRFWLRWWLNWRWSDDERRENSNSSRQLFRWWSRWWCNECHNWVVSKR